MRSWFFTVMGVCAVASISRNLGFPTVTVACFTFAYLSFDQALRAAAKK